MEEESDKYEDTIEWLQTRVDWLQAAIDIIQAELDIVLQQLDEKKNPKSKPIGFIYLKHKYGAKNE